MRKNIILSISVCLIIAVVAVYFLDRKSNKTISKNDTVKENKVENKIIEDKKIVATKVSSTMDSKKIKSMENEETLDRISKSSNVDRYYKRMIQGAHYMLDNLARTGTQTEESTKIYQILLARFDNIDQAITDYKNEISKLSVEEIEYIDEMYQHPLAIKFNTIENNIESGNKDYKEYASKFSGIKDPVRAGLINTLIDKLSMNEHSIVTSKEMMNLTTKIYKKNVMPQNETTAKFMDDYAKKIVSIEISYKLQNFSEQELKDFVQIKTQPAAINEHKIKNKLIQNTMRLE
jgi:hypothetical protein